MANSPGIPASNRKLVISAVGLSLLAVMALVVLTGGFSNFRSLLAIPWRYLVGICLLVLTIWIVDGLRVQTILRVLELRIPLIQLIRINLASNFFAAITPMAAGGPAAQTYYLFHWGVPLDSALTVVSIKLIMSLLFFSIVTPLLLLGYRDYLQLPAIIEWLVAAAVLLVLLGLGIFLYLVSRPVKVCRVVSLVTGLPLVCRWIKNRDGIETRIFDEVARFRDTLLFLCKSKHKAQVGLSFAYTVLIWTAFFTIAPVIMAGMGLKAPFLMVLGRQTIIYFVVAYVPLPGGSGAAELGFASMFISLVPLSGLAGLVAGWRLFTYYVNLIMGGIMVTQLLRKLAQRDLT